MKKLILSFAKLSLCLTFFVLMLFACSGDPNTSTEESAAEPAAEMADTTAVVDTMSMEADTTAQADSLTTEGTE